MRNDITAGIHARDIREGDWLPGLDNGYVTAVEKDEPVTIDGVLLMPDGILVSYDTADGDPAYLLLPPDALVTVRREVSA